MIHLFVVLNYLCIIVASGFTVPFGGEEVVNYGIPDDGKSQTVSTPLEFVTHRLNTSSGHKQNLQRNSNIDEKELYEDATVKQINVNERSFVLLKQKFKKPAMAQSHSLELQLNKSGKQIENEFVKTDTVCGNPSQKHQLITQNMERFVPYTNYQPDKIENNIGKENIDLKTKLKLVEDIIGNERQYLELLKPPFLGTLNKDAQKIEFDTVHNNELYLSNIEFFKHGKKLANAKLKHSKSPIVSQQEIQEQIKKYSIGFLPPYQIQRSAFRNNEISFNPDEDNNSEGSFADVDNLSPLDMNVDDDQLDRYIKDTLGEQGSQETNNDQSSKCDNCSSKNRKENPNRLKHKKLNCKCETHMQKRRDLKITTVPEKFESGSNNATDIPNVYKINDNKEV